MVLSVILKTSDTEAEKQKHGQRDISSCKSLQSIVVLIFDKLELNIGQTRPHIGMKRYKFNINDKNLILNDMKKDINLILISRKFTMKD